jgi:hypothetical protein
MQLMDAFQSQQSNTEGIKSSGDLAVAHPLRRVVAACSLVTLSSSAERRH